MELKVEHVRKKYKQVCAVDDFSVTLTEGIHGLLGANGSGKTTLMRIICGLLRPSEGIVAVDGVDIRQAGETYRELLGYLPQQFGYYPNFTGWDFLMYLAALKGLPKMLAAERTEALLGEMGLYHVRHQKLKTYSGGMLQRIGIAQALLNHPKILVMDEPTAGLDPKERANFRRMLTELERDKIVLLSTHIVSDVEKIADDIVIMKEGRLTFQGENEDDLEALYLSFFQEREDKS